MLRNKKKIVYAWSFDESQFLQYIFFLEQLNQVWRQRKNENISVEEKWRVKIVSVSQSFELCWLIRRRRDDREQLRENNGMIYTRGGDCWLVLGLWREWASKLIKQPCRGRRVVTGVLMWQAFFSWVGFKNFSCQSEWFWWNDEGKGNNKIYCLK